MIKRCLLYVGMALAMCMGSFAAQASERLEYLVSSFAGADSFAAQTVKHELTVSQWRTGSEAADTLMPSNLIAISNHFGMVSAAQFSVPDWDTASII